MATTSAEAAPPPSLHHALSSAVGPPLPSADPSLPIPTVSFEHGHSESSDGLEFDHSLASNNTTTQSPPPQPAIALHPPTFQELPPLPSALQHPLSPDSQEHEDGAMGATAQLELVGAPAGTSKSECLKSSIGHLKQEMRNLRNADIALLYQLNELHQQILAYKIAMSERLERQSETNSEYSNSLAEDFEEEDEDDFDDEEEELERGELGEKSAENHVRHGLQSLVINGEVKEGGVTPPRHHPSPHLQLPPHPRRPPQPQPAPPSPTHRIPPTSATAAAASIVSPASLPRSSLQQLRQQLPPPPPRPGGRSGDDGGPERHPVAAAHDSASAASTGVHHWLDLNFQPDSYNC